MAAVRKISDRIAVMLGGKIIEDSPSNEIIGAPNKAIPGAAEGGLNLAFNRIRRYRAASVKPICRMMESCDGAAVGKRSRVSCRFKTVISYRATKTA